MSGKRLILILTPLLRPSDFGVPVSKVDSNSMKVKVNKKSITLAEMEQTAVTE